MGLGSDSMVYIAVSMMAAFGAAASETIPPKTVVLTFDDAEKSHLTEVAPLLKEHGFSATFFITHAWMNDTECFLTWEEVAQLHRMGFEIGNHTWTHAGFNTPRQAARLAGELALVENELAKVDVPKPISFAWTGNAFGPECVAVLERAGYQLARRGMQPEAPYSHLELGPLFDPTRHHALLIPSAGDAYPDWTLDHFKKVVDRIGDGQIAVVQFHGVPDVRHPWVHTPVDRFREYMDYLKQGGFNVIALRDVLPYLPEKPVEADAMLRTLYPGCGTGDHYWPTEVEQTLEGLEDWIPNMARHRYSLEEMVQVTALPKERVAGFVESFPTLAEGDGLLLLPYPGGRHPRIGFLEGAIDPLRGTKVSIFPPWEDGGYVVLDIPEAIFSNLGLTFLAHTHIPTIWNEQNKVIENRDWIVDQNGLHYKWPLDNGIVFGASVSSKGHDALFELWLVNGTEAALTGLRTQVCLMLKGAPGFDEQNNDRKQYDAPLTLVKARDADRWILLAFERCGRAWGNERCPCVHSDPVLPDAAPGARVAVHGRLRFYEGSDIADETKRFLADIPLASAL